MGALSGVVVLDLSRYIAGPTATMMLADQGAEVVKVEPLPAGDPSRQSGPFVGGESVYFMSANRNKRSLAVDLRAPEGLDVVRRLADRADVLVENFKPGTTASMGLAPQDLAASNPRLVHCSITGFGTGPRGVGMAGFDQNAQGMSGLMSVTGTDATGPLRVGVPVADSVTGLVASFAVTAKLLERERTGVGGPVSTSLLQSASFLLTYQAQKYLTAGVVAGREGNDHPLLFPQGTFATGDGHVTIASGNERMWRQLCGALGLEAIAEDPRFAANEGRLRHKHELRELMETVLAGGSTEHWIAHVGAAGVPCGSVLGVDEVYEHPVAEELRLAEEVEHRTLGALRVLGRPAVTDDEPWLRSAPPVLGEHSLEVLAGLGLDPTEVAGLVRRGVVLAGGPGGAAEQPHGGA